MPRRQHLLMNETIFQEKESTPMTNPTNKIATQRMSPSWRKHVRRLKQEARKTGTAYKTSRPVVSIPQAPKKLP